MAYHADLDFFLVLPATETAFDDPSTMLAALDLDHLVEDGFDGNHANLLAAILDVSVEGETPADDGSKLIQLRYRGAVTGWNENDLGVLADAGFVGFVLATGEDNQSFGWLLTRKPGSEDRTVKPWGSSNGPARLHLTSTEAQILQPTLDDIDGRDAHDLRTQLAALA